MKFHEYALAFLGIKYTYGGDDAIGGFDCSGLVSECLRAFGVIRYDQRFNAAQLLDLFKTRLKPIYTDGLYVPGSVIFFGEITPTHVAIAISQNLMVEAGGGDSTTLNEAEDIKKNAFVRIRPINYRKNIIGYVNLGV